MVNVFRPQQSVHCARIIGCALLVSDFDATAAFCASALYYVYLNIYIGLSFSYRKSHVCAFSVSPDIIIIIYYRRLANTVYIYHIPYTLPYLVTLFIIQVHAYYYYCMYNICAADSD